MKSVVIVCAVLVLIGCSSTTVINSEPNGAAIYINSERVGVTPYTFTDTRIMGSTNVVTLKKDGYQDFTASFTRNEEAAIGPIIGGVFFLVPFLWGMEYKPSHFYEMIPQKAATNP